MQTFLATMCKMCKFKKHLSRERDRKTYIQENVPGRLLKNSNTEIFKAKLSPLLPLYCDLKE